MGQLRKSRRDRTRQGVRVDVNRRDIAIKQLLRRYKYLDTRQVWALLPDDVRGNSYTHFQKRLMKLTDWGLIKRTLDDYQPRNIVYLGHEIYEDGEKGSEYGLYEESITGLAAGHGLQLSHALMICSALCSLELGARKAGLRFITWPEIFAKAPKETREAKDPLPFRVDVTYKPLTGTKSEPVTWRPDSPPFGFGYGLNPEGKELAIFGVLEAERTNKVTRTTIKQTSFLKKYLCYREVKNRGLYHKQYGLPHLYVFVVAPSALHIQNMKAAVRDVSPTGDSKILFQRIPIFGSKYETIPPMPELVTTAWERAGHEPLDISKA